jgi:hypothetical protein
MLSNKICAQRLRAALRQGSADNLLDAPLMQIDTGAQLHLNGFTYCGTQER